MEFYVSLYQLTEDLGRLKRGFQQMAGRSFRISPRGAQANHDVFNQCAEDAQVLEILVNTKADFSKTTLNRTALLFQALEATHRRLVLLTGAAEPGVVEEIPAGAVWRLLGLARRHFRILWETLSERAGAPVALTLPAGPEIRNLTMILHREETLRRETHQIIEKILVSFDQDQDLVKKLLLIRNDLVEARGILKHTV